MALLTISVTQLVDIANATVLSLVGNFVKLAWMDFLDFLIVKVSISFKIVLYWELNTKINLQSWTYFQIVDAIKRDLWQKIVTQILGNVNVINMWLGLIVTSVSQGILVFHIVNVSKHYGPDHLQVFWKHKVFGNISQLETRPLIWLT